MAGEEAEFIPLESELDSGIDSDDDMTMERLADLQMNESSSSDDEVKDVEVNYPLLQSRVREDMERLKKNSHNADSEVDRSSPQLLEVELTASEDEDSSVLELVIPLQSARCNRIPKKSSWFWFDMFFCYCCFP